MQKSIKEMKAEVVKKVEYYINKYNSEFKSDVHVPPVDFSLKNTTAGIHSAREGIPKTSKLNFNLEILKLNYDDYIVQTVGHEVAHHICFVKYGVERTTPRFKSTGRIISHGKRWKFTMMALGLNVKRCHNYQLPECFTKKLFIYECGCMKHSLTKTRHNKVLKGSASYGCTICGKTLKHVK